MRLRPKTITARQLRRAATDTERMLWTALREKLPDWKFRRQHPIGKRVAEFACPAAKLVIELDGGQHGERADADAARSLELSEHGYRVIRFWNVDVVGNLDGVLEAIRNELGAAPPHPDPLRPRGAERG